MYDDVQLCKTPMCHYKKKCVVMVATHFCIKMNRLSYKSSNFVCMMLFMCIYAKYSVFLYQKMRCYGNHMFSLKYYRGNYFHIFEAIEVRFRWHYVTTILPNLCGLNNFHIIQAIKVKSSMYDDLGA